MERYCMFLFLLLCCSTFQLSGRLIFWGHSHPESSTCCLRSPVLQRYNNCWTCHLLPVFICFSLNGMNSLLWVPSSNPLLELFILLYCHCGSNLTRSLSTKRVGIVMCHCQSSATCCASVHFSPAEIPYLSLSHMAKRWRRGRIMLCSLKHHKDKSNVDLTFKPSPKVASDAKQKIEWASWSWSALHSISRQV